MTILGVNGTIAALKILCHINLLLLLDLLDVLGVIGKNQFLTK